MRRKLLIALVGIVGSSAAVVACGASVRHATVERIAGVERPRSFASATAYEAFLRAELAVSRGDPAAGARQLELAGIADPSDPFLAARRAEILLLAGQRPAAVDAAREATHRFPTSGAAWLALGETLADAGDTAGASTAYTRALAVAPDDPEVRGAVARSQGARPAQIGAAIESAPDARAGDRTNAQRLGLDPMRNDRPTLRSVRRLRAVRAWDRHAYHEVDAILTPIVTADPSDIIDRVRVVEARARDGRSGDAARLMAGVPIGDGARGVSAAEHARLWLLAGRADLAAEEADRAFRADANDLLARVVLGEARALTGDVATGARLLAEVPAGSAQFIDARIAAARALSLASRGDDASASLVRAITLLPREDTSGRDRLRLARAQLLIARGAVAEAREVLAAIESPLGRQRRGAMLANEADPATVLADLRARSASAWDDAVADAWIALLCFQHARSCVAGERDRALASARALASEAPETLRAFALATTERRTAIELLRQAALRDPMSPWNGVLSRQLGFRASGAPSSQ